MADDLWSLDATALSDGYRRGSFTPVDAAESVLGRIDDRDEEINAFCAITPEITLEQADRSRKRYAEGAPYSALDGVPVSIKDNILTTEWISRRGSVALPPVEPTGVDAPAAALLRGAGAVLLGKTTMPELGWKAVTDSSLTGTTRNPWDLAKTPGGSSGGAAAAVAAGMGPIGLGTDGGGSIRIPAAFTGTVGFKPSRGLVPLWPASAFGLLAHVGPIARSVADVALTMSVIGRPDDRDQTFDHRAFDPMEWPHEPLELPVLRLAYIRDYGDRFSDPEVASVLDANVVRLGHCGATVEQAKLSYAGLLDSFLTMWFTGASVALASLVSTSENIDPGLWEIVERAGAYSARHIEHATQRHQSFAEELTSLFEFHDFLVTPTVPILPFAINRDVPDGWPSQDWPSWTPMTFVINSTGFPAISIPAGLSSTGLPVGLQIIGPFGSDRRLLQAASAIERAIGRITPAFPDSTIGKG